MNWEQERDSIGRLIDRSIDRVDLFPIEEKEEKEEDEDEDWAESWLFIGLFSPSLANRELAIQSWPYKGKQASERVSEWMNEWMSENREE